MDPLVFLLGGALTACSWFVHFLLWRFRRPKDDLTALAACMVGLPFFFSLCLMIAGWLPFLTLGAALLLSLFLGLAYFFWYPAAQAVSPTMLMTLLVAWKGHEGMTAKELRSAIPESVLTGDTFDNLFAEGFAYREGDSVYLSGRGQRTLRAILFLRRLAGFGEPRG